MEYTKNTKPSLFFLSHHTSNNQKIIFIHYQSYHTSLLVYIHETKMNKTAITQKTPIILYPKTILYAQMCINMLYDKLHTYILHNPIVYII